MSAQHTPGPLSMSMFATRKDYEAAVSARRVVNVRAGDEIMADGIRYRFVRRHRDAGYLECIQLSGHPALVGTVQVVAIAKATGAGRG